MKRFGKTAAVFALVCGMVWPGPASAPVEAAGTAGIASDFEDGSAQGWFGRGGSAVAAVTEEAHSGSHSLKSTGRTQSWEGPGFDASTLGSQPGAYDFSAWVKLESGHADAVVNVTVESQTAGKTAHDFAALVHGTTVKSGEWTQIKGSYTLASNLDYVQIYFESPDAALSFYIDDVRIVQTAAPSTDFLDDFENGATQGWKPRIGSETVAVTTDAAHGGTSSLMVAGRAAAPYTGAAKDVTALLFPGQAYHFSAWTRLVSASGSETIKLTMQTNKGSSENYLPITSGAANSGQWVKLEGDFTYSAAVDRLTLYFESEHAGVDFYVDDVTMTRAAAEPPLEIQKDIPSLKDVFAHDFLIGTAFTNDELDGGPNEELMAKHFNVVTPGNILKWDSTEPTEGNFQFGGGDEALKFATDHGLQIRGHTLVWHSQTPDWVFRDANGRLVSKDVLYARMERHIKNVVGHYKGKMYAWDVVNEAIDASQPDGLRRSYWYQIAGEEYIVKAFQFAKEADPDAKLFINDYGTENPAKAQALYDLVKRLKAKGVPIDGVGHQFHIDIEYPTIGNMEQAILKFADLGVIQHVTELDMSVYTNNGQKYDEFTEQMAIEQAYRYKQIFDMFRRHTNLLSSVTLWGKDDGHTWLSTFPVVRNNWPLLFDKRLQAKYAYWALVDPGKVPVLTRQLWSRRLPAKTREPDWDVLTPAILTGVGTLQAQFKTAWDDRSLHVWVDVTDSSDNKADAVTVCLNQDGKTSVYKLTRKEAHLKGVRYEVKKRKGGYTVEAAIPWNGPVQAEAKAGFDIRATDAAGGTGSVISWNDRTNAEPPVPEKWGTLLLKNPMKVAEAAFGTPVVGSFGDKAWNRADEFETAVRVEGSGGATAKVKVLWDTGKLYVRAAVKDPVLSDKSANPWEQDSVEIFLDPNNHKAASYESDDGQYRVNFKNAATFGDSTNAAGFVSSAKQTEDGYMVEAAIPVAAGMMKKGALLGFDFQVNDDGAGNGVRSGVVTWSDPTGKSYLDTSKFGVIRLEKH